MRLFFSYLFLQFKRCIKASLKGLLVLLCTAIIVSIISFSMVKALEISSVSLAKVGIAIPEDDALMDYMTSFIESMDSIKSVCEFEYVDEEEAISLFKEGKLTAAIIIPEGFYHDVQVGLNPPAVIYFPENPGLVGSIFKEVLVAGVAYLQTAEAGVYAALDVENIYGADVSRQDIGMILSLQYVNEVLSKDKIFTEAMVSPLGDMSTISYYLIAAIIIIMLFIGITYSFMYEKQLKTVDDKLKVNGLNKFFGGFAKILAMFPFIYLTGILLYFLTLFISSKFELNAISYSKNVYMYMLIIAFTMAIYFQVIYGITGQAKTGIMVLLIINIIGVSVSGLIVPQAYMAPWVQKVGNFMPMRYWVNLLSYAVFGKGGII